MSSYDDFKDVPRVPRTDGNGDQIGVGAPFQKVTVSYGKAVDMMEAVAKLNARKRGEMPPIAGGVDDTDPALFIAPSSPSPFGKMEVAQHRALTQEQAEELKRKSREPKAPGPEPASEGLECRSAAGDPGVAGPPVSADVSHDIDADDVARPRRRTGRRQERAVEIVREVPVYRDVEKVVEKEVVKPGPFEEWSSRRVRVQIGTPDTTFNVSAVAVLKSVHGVTVILPTSNDSMTFVPRTGSEVRLAFRDEAVDTIFTGVSFEIEELSIMGLCFLDGSRRRRPDGDGRPLDTEPDLP